MHVSAHVGILKVEKRILVYSVLSTVSGSQCGFLYVVYHKGIKQPKDRTNLES